MGTLSLAETDLSPTMEEVRMRKKRKNSEDDEAELAMESRSLQEWHEIPVHLRFNRFVKNHYRPLADWKGCVGSLLYLHNETVNILTHAIPILIILSSVPTILPWSDLSVSYLPYVHVVASISPWIGSTIYHLFMNHHKGYPLYKNLLMLDMLGIWVAQNLGSLVPLCSTIYCFDSFYQFLILGSFALGSSVSLYKALTAKCPWQRRFSFILPFLFRLGVVTARMTGQGGGDPGALKYLLIQDFAAIAGAFIGASNIPERWFPGVLDLVCNSHHFMHLLVVFAAYQMHLAVLKDLAWMTAINEGRIACS